MDNFRNDRSVNVGTLFSQFYKVADFQRDYVWDEDDIGQLINDILDSFKSNQPNYFLGAIVLSDDEDNFLIVDGQQRLTTLTIIIAALREHLLSSSGFYTILTQFLSSQKIKDDGSIQNYPRLLFNDVESDQMISYIISDFNSISNFESKSETANNVKSGFLFAYEYIGKLEVTLSLYAKYFIEKVVLIPYITNSLKQALVVFETLNTKGRSLTPIDLLKNSLFSNEDESNWENLKTEWQKFKETLDRIGESEKRFLKYYILVHYSKKVSENDVFDWISDSSNTQISDTPFQFLEHIRFFAESYGYIIQSKGPDGIENKKIQNIRYLAQKGRQFFPLLISLRKISSTEQMNKILLAIESILFSYSIMRAYTGAIENTFSDWTRKLNSTVSEEDIEGLIESQIQPEVRRLGLQAYNKILTLTEKDISRKKLLYLLLRIEIHLIELTGGQYKTIKDFSNYEIEHILPKKYNQSFYPELEEKEYLGLVNHIGNLTILDKPLNRSIQNFPLSQKIISYGNSSFMLCKASVSSQQGRSTYAIAFSKVHKLSTMDADEVNERQKNIADILADIYKWNE